MAKAATKMESKEVATVAANAQLPAYLQNHTGGSGLQGLESNDFIIPRIKLLQGTSEEPKVHDAAKSGEFWLNVLDIPLGTSFSFTPLLNRKRYMLLAPMEDGKGVLARADDGKTWRPAEGKWSIKIKGRRDPVEWVLTDADVKRSGLAEFGTMIPDDPDSNPAATLFYDFLVLLHGVPEVTSPVLLSLARSSAKKGRDLNGKIGFGTAPMQARIFKTGVVQDKNNDGQEFWNWQFAANGYQEEAGYLAAKAVADQFGSVNFRGAEDEDINDGASPAPAGGGGSGEY
jgi:hypothetical protein